MVEMVMVAETDYFKLYEKMYVYENDRKEKLIARLNLPLAMIVALLSFLSYMLNSAPRSDDSMGAVFFWVFYLCSCCCILCALWSFKNAWSVRNQDLAIPVARELEAYRQEVVGCYTEESEANEYFMSVVLRYYIEGATRNARNNDERSEYLNSLSKFVIYAIVLALLSFFPFYMHLHP